MTGLLHEEEKLLRFYLKESREGFCRSGRGKSFQAEGLVTALPLATEFPLVTAGPLVTACPLVTEFLLVTACPLVTAFPLVRCVH